MKQEKSFGAPMDLITWSPKSSIQIFRWVIVLGSQCINSCLSTPAPKKTKARKDCAYVEVHRLVATIPFILSCKILTNGGISSLNILLWVFLEKNND